MPYFICGQLCFYGDTGPGFYQKIVNAIYSYNHWNGQICNFVGKKQYEKYLLAHFWTKLLQNIILLVLLWYY